MNFVSQCSVNVLLGSALGKIEGPGERNLAVSFGISQFLNTVISKSTGTSAYDASGIENIYIWVARFTKKHIWVFLMHASSSTVPEFLLNQLSGILNTKSTGWHVVNIIQHLIHCLQCDETRTHNEQRG